MAFSEFLGNPQIVAALRGALRVGRVPHAFLFTGPRGVGKYTLARLFAQAANCERLNDDACGECHTCQRIALLAEPQRLMEQGLAERGEGADAATVERVPLILQSHPDVWALVPDPVRLKSPVARPMLRIGQLRAVQRAATDDCFKMPAIPLCALAGCGSRIYPQGKVRSCPCSHPPCCPAFGRQPRLRA